MQTFTRHLGTVVGVILAPIVIIVDFLLWILTRGWYKGLLERTREADGLREIKTLEEGLAKARSLEDVFVMCKHQPPPSLRFQKSEKVLWVLPDCRYLKVKKHTTFSGGSLGASFGVTRNIDVGIGRFGGNLDEGERLEHADEGTVILTTEHIYFHGQRWEGSGTSLNVRRDFGYGLTIWHRSALQRAMLIDSCSGAMVRDHDRSVLNPTLWSVLLPSTNCSCG